MRELSRGQKAYFKDSKARDENGQLLVTYVAVKNSPDNVLLYIPTSYTNPNHLKLEDGYKSIAMYANTKNPFCYSGNELYEFAINHDCKTNGDIVESLKKEGYDSIIGTNSAGEKEITVFEANQIKSIGNRFPTMSDYSIDNSAEYRRIHFRNMTLDEHLELAQMLQEKGSHGRGEGRQIVERGEQEK